MPETNHFEQLVESLEIQQRQDQTMLRVKAIPGARRSGIVDIHDGSLKVAVTQVAEKGKANQAIRKLLSKALGISRSNLSLVSGETSSKKVFAVSNCTVAELKAAIANALSSTK
ncbi:hypothetical protein KOR42_04540 [Thalassoglobus neptunius]|uniref:UPF0235 protein KOR42_04540 n=1 Tax=Thalassoglobus neptunius TaxID=1938619 RepID=A0A5C5X2D8_9PLAN|nr:DUF167 domain-containing protein [Thalassoglobus neptunius]TWT57096.1 hypothetical protein KOR42_04540 [Thalassoglobus neptunius]